MGGGGGGMGGEAGALAAGEVGAVGCRAGEGEGRGGGCDICSFLTEFRAKRGAPLAEGRQNTGNYAVLCKRGALGDTLFLTIIYRLKSSSHILAEHCC